MFFGSFVKYGNIVWLLALVFTYPKYLEVFNYMWDVDYQVDSLKLILYTLILLRVSETSLNLTVLLPFLIIPLMALDIVSNHVSGITLIISISYVLVILGLVKQLEFSSNFLLTKRLRVLFLLVSVLSVIFFFKGSISTINPFKLLVDVYTFREEVRYEGFASYIVGWVPMILMPLVAFEFQKSKFLQLVIVGFVAVLTFLATGIKSWFFLPVLVLLPYWYSFEKIQKGSAWILSLLVVVTPISGNFFLMAYIDRVFYLPALYTQRYFEFFSDNVLYYFEDSKLSVFSPLVGHYSEPMGFVIDAAYGGNGMNANVGVFGSSYAELGLIGVVLLIPLALIPIRWMEKRHSTWAVSIALLYAYISTNSPPIDLFLTHGLIFNFIIYIAYVKNVQ